MRKKHPISPDPSHSNSRKLRDAHAFSRGGVRAVPVAARQDFQNFSWKHQLAWPSPFRGDFSPERKNIRGGRRVGRAISPRSSRESAPRVPRTSVCLSSENAARQRRDEGLNRIPTTRTICNRARYKKRPIKRNSRERNAPSPSILRPACI